MDNLKGKIKKICQEYLKKLKEESTTGGGTASSAGMTTGTGEQYATPFAFNPNKKAKGTASNYYYKLGYKLAPNQVTEIDKSTYGTGNLGPGPKATERGVEDNYYVKTFGYKLVDRKKQADASKAVDYKDLWGKTYKY